MVIPSLPTLPGLSFPVKKKPAFATIVHRAVAGNSTRQSPQPYPIYRFDLPFEFLRAADAFQEIQTLMSFYESRLGQGLPFHFNDPDDNHIAGQTIGIGDGVTTDFGFVRAIVNNAVPIQDAIGATTTVYKNGVATGPGDTTQLLTSQYGTFYGIRFVVPPAVGAVITADFSYNWLCCFDEDELEFSKFQYLNGKGLWEAKSVKFSSVPQ
jgi:uncharacterized protein (TIGR02217 family)